MEFLHEPTSLSFGVYTTEEIRKLSICEVTVPLAFDTLQQVIRNGLYDGRMGSLSGRCETCGKMRNGCTGHYGHIELALKIYNPLLFKILGQLLKITCFFCHRFLASTDNEKIFLDTLSGLEQGNISALDNAELAQKILAMSRRKDFHYNSTNKVKRGKENEEEEAYQYTPEDEFLIDEFVKSLNAREPKVPSLNIEKTEVLNDLRGDLIKNFFATMNSHQKCPSCKGPRVSIQKDRDGTRLFFKVTEKIMTFVRQSYPDLLSYFTKATDDDSGDSKVRMLNPVEVHKHLVDLHEKEPEMLRFLFGHMIIPNIHESDKQTVRDFDPSSFFLEVIPVIPNRFRPPNFVGGIVSEHSMTRYYAHAMELNESLKESLRTDKSEMMKKWIQLQSLVNYFFDSSKLPVQSSLPSGITQVLEKKAGLFRKNMMGKRVNFAARTVISPDPFLQTNQIGIPLPFALTLTFPEPVTDFNVKQLMQAVINGPHQHPGARCVEDSFGNVTRLEMKTQEERVAIAKQLISGVGHKIKKVHRHIKDGDAVVLNRQPTLHKPGMMGHFVKVLKTEKTLRMHYSNCSTFNADFDGDEMNIHFPQDVYAKVELEEIANADNQYLVPKNGTPIRGLIQDHVVSGVLLTKRDTFFTREEFCQLVFASCLDVNMDQPIKVPPPTILKPTPLWTGKQVISAVLHQVTHNFMPINLDSKSKISEDYWGKDSWEDKVIIRENELLCGVLEKNQYGASAYGLVHAVQELHGFKTAGQLLSVFSRLFTLFLQLHGFTCGIDDMLLQQNVEKERAQSLEEANKAGSAVAAAVTKLDTTDIDQIKTGILNIWGNRDERLTLDGKMRQAMHEKTSQIINKCLPAGQVKKFPMNFLSLMTVSGAKGSVVNFSQISCLLGQQELEGKRVPVMPSGKTLPCFQAFDPSARAGGFVKDRFLTGLKPQEYFFHAMAGREGLIDTAVKTSRSGYLQRCLIKHLENLKVHYDNTVRDADGSVIQFNYGEDSVDVGKSAFLQKFGFLAQNVDNLMNRYSAILTDKTGRFSGKEAAKYFKERSSKDDPTLAVFDPGSNIGSVSENFYKALNDYIEANPDNLLRSEKNPKGFSVSKFKHLMNIKYSKSLVPPGENVGLLAAQSIGEPSTQMTLNTFHLAGRGDVNVTLGIPRLREIIMTASKTISTPTMILPLKLEYNTEKNAKELLKEFQKVLLSDLVNEMRVEETLVREHDQYLRKYEIRMKFKSSIEKEYNIKYKDLSERLEKYLALLSRNLVRELEKAGGSKVEVKTSKKALAEAEEDEEEEKTNKSSTEQGDADEEDRKSKKTERVSYDDPEDEEKAGNEQDVLEDMEIMDNKEEKEKDDDHIVSLEEILTATNVKDTDIEDRDDGAVNEEESEDVTYLSKTRTQFIEGFEFMYNKKHATNPEFVMKLRIPSTSKKVLMMALLERTQFVVKQADKINRAVVTQKKVANVERWCIQTEGVNLGLLWNLQDKIDVKKVDCNDINAILNFYGVEAARGAIVKEVSDVFGVYGISVDHRHKSLVADYMTFNGKFKPMNRIGISTNSSPLLAMSFETTMQFVKKAVMEGAVDHLQSHSSRLVVGAITKGGTGCFDVMQDLSKLPIDEPKTELLV